MMSRTRPAITAPIPLEALAEKLMPAK